MAPNAVNPLVRGDLLTFPNNETMSGKVVDGDAAAAANDDGALSDKVAYFKSGSDVPFGKSTGQQAGLQTKAQEGFLHAAYASQLKTISGELHGLMGQSGSTALTSGLASRWSEFVGAVAFEKGALVDINSLVQAVLRDAYMENTKDLHFYAQKVRYFNEMKKLIRNHLTEMRDFQVKFTEFYNSLETDDDGNLTSESQAALAEWLSANSTDPLMKGMYAVASGRAVADCVATAESRVQEKYGVDLPQEIKDKMTAALESKDPTKIEEALKLFAQFLSYLGDCSVGSDGQFGSGGGYNDADHITDEPSWDDFEHYMKSDENKVARSNLASGDIPIIEAAFGLEPGALGLSGSSSVHDVVAAAMLPVNDAWAQEILTGVAVSSASIQEELRTQGVHSDYAIELYGSPQAAQEALEASVNVSSEDERQMRNELGMWGGVPPAGCNSPDALDNEIQKWEEKLNSVGDDAQLANVDLQNMLQKQQQTLQMLSNISKMLHDTAMATIRKIGG